MTAAPELSNPLRDAALDYAARGWAVLPLHTMRDAACTCKKECASPGKHPRTAHGLTDATTDPKTIVGWWDRWPDANVGIRTGAESGLVVVDLDGAAAEAAWKALRGSTPLETLAVRTGRGWHFYFKHPGFPVPNSASSLGPGIDVRGDGGYVLAPPSIHPGTGQAYRTWAPASPADMPEFLRDRFREMQAKPAPPITPTGVQFDGMTAYGRRAWESAVARCMSAPEGTRNDTFSREAYGLYQLAAGGELDVGYLDSHLPPLGERLGLLATEVVATLRNARANGLAEPRTAPAPVIRGLRVVREGEEPPAPDPDTRPQVQVNNRPMLDVSADLVEALMVSNDPPRLFVRSGQPVRVLANEKDEPYIDTMAQDQMRHMTERAARCVRINLTDGLIKDTPPPVDIVRDILAAGYWPFPPLEAVTETPTVRPDGSVMTEPGYDPPTRLLYRQPEHLDIIEPVDMDAALAVLYDLLGEFPFTEPADRAGAVAVLLTPLVRPAVTGPVPLACLDAPEAGTGKSLLARVVAVIATGRDAEVKPIPKGDEELRKTITSTLDAGQTIIVFDNAEQAVASPVLAGAITALTWSDRRLGHTEQITVPNRSTWIITGNNLKVGGDLARRCYRIRMNALTASPWKRKGFRHVLPEWALENRGLVLGALLYLCKAWWQAGKPAIEDPGLGGFSSWALTIGGILHHAGIDGFLANLDAFHAEADDEAAEWEAFLIRWGVVLEDRAVLTSELQAALESDQTFRDVLPGPMIEAYGSPNFRRRVGIALGKRADRRYGENDLRILRVLDRSKQARWQVKTAGSSDLVGLFPPGPMSFFRNTSNDTGKTAQGVAKTFPKDPKTPRANLDDETPELL